MSKKLWRRRGGFPNRLLTKYDRSYLERLRALGWVRGEWSSGIEFTIAPQIHFTLYAVKSQRYYQKVQWSKEPTSAYTPGIRRTLLCLAFEDRMRTLASENPNLSLEILAALSTLYP